MELFGGLTDAGGLTVAAALFAGGVVVGLLWPRARGRDRARIAELEAEVQSERASGAEYREAVGKHFDQTSDLFRDLTHQYTTLYAHLAEGSRELCPDRSTGLGRGFDAPGLLVGPEDAGDAGTAYAEASAERSESPSAESRSAADDEAAPEQAPRPRE